MPLLDQVCDPKARLERRTVERVISMLLWFTGGCGWLKPWLEPLYKILFKPRAIPRLVNFTRFSEFVQALDANLVVTEHVRCCDVCLKWRLHSINNCQVSSRKSSSFVTPKSRNGQISLIFYDYENPRTSSDKNAAWAAQLLKKQCGPAQGFLCHMCLAEAPLEFAAADAWADENSAGIGGWWWPSGCAATPSSARWFSIQFERADLPTWFCSSESESSSLASLHIRIRSTGPIGVALPALPIW